MGEAEAETWRRKVKHDQISICLIGLPSASIVSSPCHWIFCQQRNCVEQKYVRFGRRWKGFRLIHLKMISNQVGSSNVKVSASQSLFRFSFATTGWRFVSTLIQDAFINRCAKCRAVYTLCRGVMPLMRPLTGWRCLPVQMHSSSTTTLRAPATQRPTINY